MLVQLGVWRGRWPCRADSACRFLENSRTQVAAGIQTGRDSSCDAVGRCTVSVTVEQMRMQVCGFDAVVNVCGRGWAGGAKCAAQGPRGSRRSGAFSGGSLAEGCRWRLRQALFHLLGADGAGTRVPLAKIRWGAGDLVLLAKARLRCRALVSQLAAGAGLSRTIWSCHAVAWSLEHQMLRDFRPNPGSGWGTGRGTPSRC